MRPACAANCASLGWEVGVRVKKRDHLAALSVTDRAKLRHVRTAVSQLLEMSIVNTGAAIEAAF